MVLVPKQLAPQLRQEPEGPAPAAPQAIDRGAPGCSVRLRGEVVLRSGRITIRKKRSNHAITVGKPW